LKNPKKCPIICFAPDKKIISRTFNIRGTSVFLCSKARERERESKSKRKRESKSKKEKEKEKGKGKGKEKERERERGQKRGDFISKRTGPE
jgi:hypothetical protein